jgi:endonuclease/exonuclease/phosphatase (EEP) superfamily protein YafD
MCVGPCLRLLIVVAPLLLLACSRDGPGAPRRAVRPVTLTLASYNVLYALAKKTNDPDPTRWVDAATLRHLASLDVDVLLLQETNEAWEAAIRKAVGKRLPHCRFHPPKRWLPGGIGVCAKKPLLADELLPSSLDWFPAQRIVLEHGGGTLQILNVHLRPAGSGKTWWEGLKTTQALRTQELRPHLARLAKDAPTIIAGDFNETGEGDLFRMLGEAGYENAFTAARERGSTWRWLAHPENLNAQLDQVAYQTSAFQLVSARIVKGGNSDHLPVVVTLRARGG